MIRSRFSLLAVLMVAIGLTAVFASVAQAEGEWLVLETRNGNLVQPPALEKEIFTGKFENETGGLLSEIGTTKIDITCTAAELVDALLNATGGVKEGAKAKFTGCKFFSGGANGLETEQAKCKVKTSGGPAGTVETLPYHTLLKLHELPSGVKDETYLNLPDNAEKRFATIELGETCAFGEELPVFGHFTGWDCGGNFKSLEHLANHLLTEFQPLTSLALFAQRGKPGAKNAAVDGSFFVGLLSGREWAGSRL